MFKSYSKILKEIDEKPNEYRFRLRSPKLFLPSSFRWKEITNGVAIIIGKRTSKSKMEVQALRFQKEKFTKKQVASWISKHTQTIK